MNWGILDPWNNGSIAAGYCATFRNCVGGMPVYVFFCIWRKTSRFYSLGLVTIVAAVLALSFGHANNAQASLFGGHGSHGSYGSSGGGGSYWQPWKQWRLVQPRKQRQLRQPRSTFPVFATAVTAPMAATVRTVAMARTAATAPASLVLVWRLRWLRLRRQRLARRDRHESAPDQAPAAPQSGAGSRSTLKYSSQQASSDS